MSRPLLRGLTPLFGANGRRAIVILVVAAAGVLLAVPATAGARLDKHQKAYFKAMLGFQADEFTGSVSVFDTWCDTEDMNRDDLEALIASMNPDDLPAIQAYEESAGVFAQAIRAKVAAEKPVADKSIRRFYAKTLPWFKGKSVRRDLREGTVALRGAFAALYEAYSHLGMAVQALSSADFVTYDEESAIAKGARDGAVSLFDAGMEKLRGLL